MEDALRLSRGMTYKNAMAGLSHGGGKSVIMRDPTRGGSAALMRAFGRHIGSLSGRYIAAEDVGTSPADMEEIARETAHVAGRSGRSGDPSPVTAHGVLAGIRAAAAHRFGGDGLDGVRVAVQGLGSVGMALAGHLHEAGAKLTVTDISEARVAEAAARFGATASDLEGIYDADADIFAPCALGAVLNDGTVPRLRAGIVAGAANNQLAEDRHGEALRARGILYAPDYVVNAGGVINVSCEVAGPYDRDAALAKVSAIGPTLAEVFRRGRGGGPADERRCRHDRAGAAGLRLNPGPVGSGAAQRTDGNRLGPAEREAGRGRFRPSVPASRRVGCGRAPGPLPASGI